MKALTLALLVACANADRASLDCPLRQIAVDYAQRVQPRWRPLTAFQELADALNGAEEAVDCYVKPNASASPKARRVGTFPLPTQRAALVLFADPGTRGDDVNGDGSESRPFASVARSLRAVRDFRLARRDAATLTESDRAHLVLRAGTFHIGATLQLTAADSFLTVQAYPNEDVMVSGAAALTGLEWQHVPAAIPARPSYEYRSGMLVAGFDVAPAKVMTLAEGEAACSAMPACAAITYHDASPAPTAALKIYVRRHGVRKTTCVRSFRLAC
jgi:hypothetical protein